MHSFCATLYNKASVCQMCKEYEIQLKEELDELSSILMVNKLLQKELLSLTTTETAGKTNLDSNENKGTKVLQGKMLIVNGH